MDILCPGWKLDDRGEGKRDSLRYSINNDSLLTSGFCLLLRHIKCRLEPDVMHVFPHRSHVYGSRELIGIFLRCRLRMVVQMPLADGRGW